MSAVAAQPHTLASPSREVALVDLIDRLLHGGVVIRGQIMLCAADVELVALDLSVVVAAIDRLVGRA